MEEGANGPGPQGSHVYDACSVEIKPDHFGPPAPPAETVTTSANPHFGEWTDVTNRCMLPGEPDAPPTSLLNTFGSTANTLGSTAEAAAAAVIRKTTRNARWMASVTGSVVDACETGLGCQGFTGTVGTVSYYGSALVVATVLHYCGVTGADPQKTEAEDTVPPADPQKTTEAEDTVPPA
jgi:hypothetical protein